MSKFKEGDIVIATTSIMSINKGDILRIIPSVFPNTHKSDTIEVEVLNRKMSRVVWRLSLCSPSTKLAKYLYGNSDV